MERILENLCLFAMRNILKMSTESKKLTSSYDGYPYFLSKNKAKRSEECIGFIKMCVYFF